MLLRASTFSVAIGGVTEQLLGGDIMECPSSFLPTLSTSPLPLSMYHSTPATASYELIPIGRFSNEEG